MVMIVERGEGTLEQRIHAISSYDYSGPSYTFPVTAMHLYPRLSLENPVLMPQNLLCPVRLAFGVQVCYRCALRQNIMIGFKSELYTLLPLMKVEM